MKSTITEKKENPFLNRMEVKGTLQFDGATPSKNDLIGSLSQDLKVAAEAIEIKKIHTQFSAKEADFLAYAYVSAEARKKVEPVTAHMKKKAGENKPAEKKEEKK